MQFIFRNSIFHTNRTFHSCSAHSFATFRRQSARNQTNQDATGYCLEGDTSLEKRQTMFHEQLREAERQMTDLQKTINTLKFISWYYSTAVTAGTEAKMKELSDNDLPEELREYKI
jgi:hypothetical protein